MAAMARTVFRKYPFVTNSLIYGSLYVGAEFSQQFLMKRVLVSTNSSSSYSHHQKLINFTDSEQETHENHMIFPLG